MPYQIRITPMSERIASIERGVKSSEKIGETIFDFRGGTLEPKVIRLPVEVPVYRMGNCRTFSQQQTYIHSKKKDRDFFKSGRENSDVQQAQHELLMKLLNPSSESVDSISSILQREGQREDILISNSGEIINGNRRMCAMRELYESGDERFEFVNCAVLPSDIKPDEIDDLEAYLQARPRSKMEYDWIGDAYLIRRQSQKGRSIKTLSKQLNRSTTEIEKVLCSMDEADLYLKEWIKKPNQYEHVLDGQQIFSELCKNLKKIDRSLHEACRVIAWSIFENRNKISGRIYRLRDTFGKDVQKVLEIFSDNIDFEEIEQEVPENHEFDIDIQLEGEIESDKYESAIKLIREDKKNENVFETLLNACETTIEIEIGRKGERAALVAISQANSKLAGIDPEKAGEVTLPAIKKQIGTIRSTLDRLESVIDKRMKTS